jgi:hypothetical protein
MGRIIQTIEDQGRSILIVEEKLASKATFNPYPEEALLRNYSRQFGIDLPPNTEILVVGTGAVYSKVMPEDKSLEKESPNILTTLVHEIAHARDHQLLAASELKVQDQANAAQLLEFNEPVQRYNNLQERLANTSDPDKVAAIGQELRELEVVLTPLATNLSNGYTSLLCVEAENVETTNDILENIYYEVATSDKFTAEEKQFVKEREQGRRDAYDYRVEGITEDASPEWVVPITLEDCVEVMGPSHPIVNSLRQEKLEERTQHNR